MSQAKIEALLKEKKFRQAIEEIKKLQRSQPGLSIHPSEAVVWILRGKQELDKDELKAAENSFRQSLKLGLVGEAHYWLAKSLLLQNRLDAAIDLIRDAFETKLLPKENAICYLKLLLIKGDRETVESLIKTQSKRFSAPQLHWARGVLALQSDDPATALTSFNKIKQPVTRGDSPEAWIIYTNQKCEKWAAATVKLGLYGTGKPIFGSHPVLQRLASYQQGLDGKSSRAFIAATDRVSKEIFIALSIIQMIEDGNVHDAGHALLPLSITSSRLSELMALRSTILLLAGQQAMQQGETSCILELWKPLLQGKDFRPQVAVNLLQALEIEEEYHEAQRLLIRLVKWIEEDAKRDRANWSDERRNLTLAHGHCLIADTWVSLGRGRAAFGAVNQAAKICPTSPEVIGRQGLMLGSEGKIQPSIDKMTQALELGCQSSEVYEAVQELLIDLGKKSEALDIRKRFGKRFGDLNAEAEVEMEHWIEALSTQHYEFFKGLLPLEKSTDPVLRACQIFCEAAHGKLTGTGKTSIHQDKATAAWDKLLAPLDPETQVTTLQAIALSIELMSKRDKGIAALVTHYMTKIIELQSTVPAAILAHLIVLATREKNTVKLQRPVGLYVNTKPNPNNALAQLQLQVRWFGLGLGLRSLLDKALLQEPQNPLLLLAKATTYTYDGPIYTQLREQGFELARQLQDAEALQAFRIEEHYSQTRDVQAVIPNPSKLDNMTPKDFEAFFETMIRKTLGKQIPKAELDRLMPMLKQKFMDDMINGGPSSFGGNPFGGNPFLDDDDDDDLFFTGKRSKKRTPFF